MSVGTVSLRVVLDQPNKIHYGNEAPVTGSVAVTYTPSAKYAGGELFGPLRLTITLHGRCKTKIWKRQGQNTHIYRGRLDLFSIQKTVLQDQFRSSPGQTQHFPFEIDFPSTPQPNFNFGWDADGKYHAQELLPPSFREDSRGLGHHYESFIEYRIGATAVMPNIRVDITSHGKYDEPIVRYERPRLSSPVPSRPIGSNGVVSVSNEYLIPPEQRPAGFKQKMKVAFTSNNFPTYAFSWKLSGAQSIHLLQPLVFAVSIKPIPEQCTAPLVPAVLLARFVFEIKANTYVRAEKGIFTYPESSSENTLATTGSNVTDRVPFSKANDWTKNINIGRIIDFPSQFTTPNIVRTYTMKIKITFQVAGATKEFTFRSPLSILPPLQTIDPGVGSSSAAAADASTMSADDMILPQYEPPPNYESDLKA